MIYFERLLFEYLHSKKVYAIILIRFTIIILYELSACMTFFAMRNIAVEYW